MKNLGKGIRKYGMAYLFVIPAVALVSIFMMIPLVRSFYLSAFKWNGLRAPKFVGLNNYAKMISDPKFGQALS
ncbi:MAG: sugar ABC transporter permease, partial [Ruthenibacterium sp.]